MATRRAAAAWPRGRRAHPCVPVRNEHYADSAARRFRVLKITTWIAALISGGFGLWQLLGDYGVWRIGLVNVVTAFVLLAIPHAEQVRRPGRAAGLHRRRLRIGVLLTWNVGTGSGLQFYFIVSASILVLILGIERIVLAGVLAAAGHVLPIMSGSDRALMTPACSRPGPSLSVSPSR